MVLTNNNISFHHPFFFVLIRFAMEQLITVLLFTKMAQQKGAAITIFLCLTHCTLALLQ